MLEQTGSELFGNNGYGRHGGESDLLVCLLL